MGFMDALKRLTKPYDDDEGYLDDETDEPRFPRHEQADNTDYTAYAQAPREEPQQRKSIFSPALGGMEGSAARQGTAVPSAQTAVNPMKLMVFKPQRFEDARGIADQLKANNSVVLNIENTPKDEARRLVDFISGFTYALNGRVRRIAAGTYIVTPTNVELMGGELGSAEGGESIF